MEFFQVRVVRRQNDFEVIVQFQQYLVDLYEVEVWIREKEFIVDNINYGVDEEVVEVRWVWE